MNSATPAQEGVRSVHFASERARAGCASRWHRGRGRAIALTVSAALVLLAFLVWFLMRDHPFLGDERVHARQIQNLVAWMTDGGVFDALHPAIPGYHFVIAVVAALTGASSVAAYRATSVTLGLLLAAAAFTLTWALSNEDARLSTLRMMQVFFLAISFPFLGLLYTDLFSASLVLFSFALLFRERYAWAGVVGTLSMAVRQNNVLWLGAAFLLTCVGLWRKTAADVQHLPERDNVHRSTQLLQDRRLFIVSPDAIVRRVLPSLAPFLVGFTAFAAFVVWNGGQIALADRRAHPPFTFHLGNVWAITFTACFLFLPLAIARACDIVRLCRGNVDALWLGAAAVASLYLMTFRPTHPYNFLPWWLHNKVLLLATSSLMWKLVFLVPLLYQVLVFMRTPLWRPELHLLYPFAALYLAASWLIEPRYFFIPLMLFLLFRRPQERWVEWALVAWNALGGAVIFWGVYHGRWLP